MTIKSNYINIINILFELKEFFEVSFLKNRAKFCKISFGLFKLHNIILS